MTLMLELALELACVPRSKRAVHGSASLISLGDGKVV